MNSKKISIFIVDDHPLMRQALKTCILAESDMEVTGQAENGKEALELVSKSQPDVILIDLLMPKMDGFETIEHLLNETPQLKILVITSVEEESKILKVMSLGAMGYLLKDTKRDEIIKAIRTVYAGDSYLPPNIARKLINILRQPPAQETKAKELVASLTGREKDVFEMLGQGYSNQKIAKELHISVATVRVHRHNISNKFGFQNRREVVVYAVEQRLKNNPK